MQSAKSLTNERREQIWAVSLALQAVNRNTHLMCFSPIGNHPAAGPGTRQYFYEGTAGHIASIVSGTSHIANTRKYKIGRTSGSGTPLETRWMGEVARAVPGMSRASTNRIVNYLLGKYESHLEDAPSGGTYHDLYDADDGPAHAGVSAAIPTTSRRSWPEWAWSRTQGGLKRARRVACDGTQSPAGLAMGLDGSICDGQGGARCGTGRRSICEVESPGSPGAVNPYPSLYVPRRAVKRLDAPGNRVRSQLPVAVD